MGAVTGYAFPANTASEIVQTAVHMKTAFAEFNQSEYSQDQRDKPQNPKTPDT